MKKILLCIMLLFVGTIGVNAADIFPDKILQNVEKSLVVVHSKRNSLGAAPYTAYKGTGFVVQTSKEETVVCTATHVIDDKSAPFFTVEIFDNEYRVTDVVSIPETDISYLIIRPGINNVKALEFELSDSTSTIDIMVFGFGNNFHEFKQKPKATFSVGKIQRNVSEKMSFIEGEEGGPVKLFRYMLYGTAILINGYSGGPCLDANYKVICASHGYSKGQTIFMDGRAIYNFIPNNKHKVRIPIDKTFDVQNGTEVRIDEDGAVIQIGDTQHLLQHYAETNFRLILKNYGNLFKVPYEWITQKPILIIINNKKYSIYRVELIAETYLRTYKFVTGSNRGNKYIYLCDNGWSLLIALDEQ